MYFKEFKELQFKHKQELEQRQWKKFKMILEHAYKHVPYYREFFLKNEIRPNDIKSKDDIVKLPLLTKQEIRKNFKKLIATNIPKNRRRVDTTSGSTGEPLIFLWDKYSNDLHAATGYLFNSWARREVGDKILYISNPRPNTNLLVNLYNKLSGTYFLSILDLNNKPTTKILKYIMKIKPKIIYGYVSALSLLATWIKENKVEFNFKIKSIIATSETLDPFIREKIKEAFKVEIFNRYGSREFGNIMQDCEEHNG
ncbi:MAG: hypothetical protein QXS37_05830, partial [Candidatus Aenigmatarchaeota archaeon]